MGIEKGSILVGDKIYEASKVTCGDSEEVETETLIVTPTKSEQVLNPSTGKYIDEVIVNPIGPQYPDVSDTTATAEDVASGEIFYDAQGQRTVGTGELQTGVDLMQWKCDNMNSLNNEFGSYRGTFPNLDSLDTKNVKTFVSIFNNSYIENAPNWDLSNAESVERMFDNCNKLQYVPNLNTSKVTNFYAVFGNCLILENAPAWDTSNGTNMYGCFQSCIKLKTVPETWKFSKSTNCGRIFYNANALTSIHELDFSSATNLSSAFYRCSSLETLNLKNTNNVTDWSNAFSFSTMLKSINGLDFSSAQNCSHLFDSVPLEGVFTASMPNITRLDYTFRSTNLTEVHLETSNKITRVDYMFEWCDDLKTVETIDLYAISSNSYQNNMFSGCNNLENLTLKNIRRPLQIGSGTSWGTKLTNESLINTFKELWDLTGSTAATLTLSTTSKNNIANIYVKLVDVTDEMRAEDEYIDNKKPCVVCESTDEGAMTLIAYGTSKNWTIS